MYSASLHVAMGKFALGMDVVYHLREKKNKQVRDKSEESNEGLEHAQCYAT